MKKVKNKVIIVRVDKLTHDLIKKEKQRTSDFIRMLLDTYFESKPIKKRASDGVS